MPKDFEQYLEDNAGDEIKAQLVGLQKSFREESKLDKLIELVKSLLPNAESVNDNKAVVEIHKSIDEEERLALFVVLAPDEEDLHGDIYSAAEIEKGCNNFNQFCGVANLFHKVETEKAVITQSFINLCDFEVEDGRLITKGSWLQWVHFPKDDKDSDELWELTKSGEINGLSVGCTATCEELEEE